jgi:AcrR family transcriptional regulator
MATVSEEVPERQLTPRGLRTRAQLVAAARTIFERDGFVASRITDIADEAAVSHGTFYTYFDSKEQIFREVLESIREVMLSGGQSAEEAVLEAVPDGRRSARESIARANRRYLEAYRDNCQLMIIWEQAATLNEEFRSLLADSRHSFTGRSERFIRRLQETGAAEADIDPYYAAHALTAMMSRFAYVWFLGGERFEFETAVDQVTRLWCNALGLREDV